MTIPVPPNPKIYHIVHIDKLSTIMSTGALLCDSEILRRAPSGTTIGMGKIKKRRLSLPLNSHSGLMVGDCVPFYFCPRSVMLYMFHMNNHDEIDYHGGQEPIVHLVSDLYETVQWANSNNHRWAFTLSNAGAFFFEDRANLNQLNEINWDSVNSTYWSSCRDAKQSEFLIEGHFPWELVQGIAVYSDVQKMQIDSILHNANHRPIVKTKRNWYY